MSQKFYGMTAKICVTVSKFPPPPQSAVKYQEYFLQPMLKCICDKSPTVRQVYKIHRSTSHGFVCVEFRNNYYVMFFSGCQLWGWSYGSELLQGFLTSMPRLVLSLILMHIIISHYIVGIAVV